MIGIRQFFTRQNFPNPDSSKFSTVKILRHTVGTISETVSLGDVDESSDFQDEGMPMQRLPHLSSLILQVSLNYLYCLIPLKMWSQHFSL